MKKKIKTKNQNKKKGIPMQNVKFLGSIVTYCKKILHFKNKQFLLKEKNVQKLKFYIETLELIFFKNIL